MEVFALVMLVLFLAAATDDGLDFTLDLIRDSVARVYTMTAAAFRFARLTAAGLSIAYVVFFTGFIFSLYLHRTSVVIGSGIALIAIAATFFMVANWLTPKTYVKLDGSTATRPGPSMLATIMLLPLPVILYALVAPWHLYNWFLPAYGVFLLAGFPVVVIGKINRSLVFYAPYAIAIIMFLSAISFAATMIFEQEVRAMVIARKTANRDNGRDNLAKEISLRVEDKIVDDVAYWWHYSEDSDDGEPIMTRFIDEATGKQCYSKKGDLFKTVDPSANSSEVGGTYIPIYFKDPKTGEYVFVDEDKPTTGCVAGFSEDRVPWIKASSTTVGGSASFEQIKQQEAAPQPQGKLVASGQISVAKRMTSIGTYSGKITVVVSGSATLDSTRENFGPTGWTAGGPAPNFFALPGATMFSAIAKIKGKYQFVGESIELDLSTPTLIELGPNDEPGTDGLGYKDNGGYWSYQVYKVSNGLDI